MTGFNEEQTAALGAQLARANVKTRKQAGRDVSYIEGWVAVAEANRIFGFDGWDRETVECRCVSEKPCVIGAGGQYEKPGFRVAYVGKVRVTVRAGERVVVREGTGYGSGIDADVGEAHESAIKECETDAAKRALMTFGNPFGLALYDKTQAEVEPIQRGAGKPADARSPVPPRQAALPTNGHVAPTSAPLPPPNPEEPPEIAEKRRQAAVHFWTRNDYSIDPAVIQGGIGRWDAEMLAQARAAPNLDTFTKLKEDNRPFFVAWSGQVAKPVVESFNGHLATVYRKLMAAEERAA